jgi:hypothetical protein
MVVRKIYGDLMGDEIISLTAFANSIESKFVYLQPYRSKKENKRKWQEIKLNSATTSMQSSWFQYHFARLSFLEE